MELRPYKKELPHSYTFGVFPTLELLQHLPQHAIKVIASEAGLKNTGVAKLTDLCTHHNLPFEVNTRLVQRLAPKENTYVVGVFNKYTSALVPNADHVLLVNPSDMGNLGTIMRTMLGFSASNLAIIRPAADHFDPRAIRASMGAIFSLNTHYFDTYEQYSSLYSTPTRTLYPFITGSHTPLPSATFTHPHTLIFGNESSGLPDLYTQLPHSHPITIPQSPQIDSLNLTIAVALALYEVASTRM